MMADFAAGKAARRVPVFAAVCAFALNCALNGAAQTPAPQNPSQNPNQTGSRPVYSGSASPEAQPAPTLTITTREVLLDVVVTDENHRPVTGLKASDFTITEEGQPQTIRRMEEHSALSGVDVTKLKAAPPLPANTFTNFTPVANSNAYTVILLDALNTPVSSQMYLRQQLIDYLKHDMQPGTPIAIFQLDVGMKLIQGFSTDPQVLLAAAESKRNMPSLQRAGSRQL